MATQAVDPAQRDSCAISRNRSQPKRFAHPATLLRRLRWSAILSPALTRLGVLMAHPAAFIALVCYVVASVIFNRHSFDWQSVATVATLLMTLFIQRAEHRDTQAIHAKLDELLRAEGRARSELTQLDDEEPEEIEQHRRKERLGGRNTLQPR